MSRDPQPPAKASSPRDLRAFLEAARDRLAAALPKHLTPDKLIQLAASMAYKNPRLAQCDQGSILVALTTASSLGLDITPGMNEGALVPVWNKHTNGYVCDFRVMYQGIVKLLRQSGVVGVRSAVVREGDEFVYGYTPDLVMRHLPALSDRGAVVGVYATATLPDGSRVLEYMDRAEVEAIRARSQSPNDGPWVTDWSEMARKTVLKRLGKHGPRSVELQRAINHDNSEYEAKADVSPARPAPLPHESRSSALANRLGPVRELEPPAPAAAIEAVEDAIDLGAEDDEGIMASEGGRSG